MNIGIVTQARMTSTRLPGKVLKTVLDKPLLQYHLEQLQQVRLADRIIVATTTNATDNPIIQWCDRLAIAYYRGSENDVLSRYYHAAKTYQIDPIIRVTSDCPLIDPEIVDRLIQSYLDSQPPVDYFSNCLERTYPRGMDAEIFSFKSLEEAFQEATAQPDREHVTPFIYRQPQRYRIAHLKDKKNNSHHRWTVDTPEDFQLIEKIIKSLSRSEEKLTFKNCLILLENHPEWSKINTHIEQKKYGQ
ncbi:cytidylyltransferase domain-containing protein [Oxynema aestuarii]|uniref:NTP transferase domain-containing protein n=1 Tax=Oxynema aestuarii AP17 TaxID=2064643 RepID=A0A6H1U395_9CYAN|nr:glycosyltransferase family protein [Oxynema aestuarii]QIZ73125.1 NTP transferase domain-containing protein [Oxynema aestuarii AP17]